jgi:sugar O-acyltransferase (sialic acid O-acetyltransferase NeuD family)
VNGRALFVAGTRSFSAEVACFAEDADFEVVGLLEPYERARVGTQIHGYPVRWLEETPPSVVLLGSGETDRRPLVGRLRAGGWELPTLVHPQAHVAATARLGAGAIIAPGAVVGAAAQIGECVIVGRGALVGHHTDVGSFSTLGPGANIAGNVGAGEDVFVGMGAVVRDHVSVGAGSVIAMGGVVVEDVPPGVEVRGLPAAVYPFGRRSDRAP